MLTTFPDLDGDDDSWGFDDDEFMDYAALEHFEPLEDQQNVGNSSSLKDGMDFVKPKKKRKRNRKTCLIPRVLKRDIRRYYAAMLTNAFNTHDPYWYQAFFRSFCTADVVVKKVHVDLSLPTGKLFSQHFGIEMLPNHALRGFKWVLLQWTTMSRLNPDNVISLVQSKVVTRSDTEKSSVLFSLEASLTRIYDVNPLHLVDDMFETMMNLCPESATKVFATEDETTPLLIARIEQRSQSNSQSKPCLRENSTESRSGGASSYCDRLRSFVHADVRADDSMLSVQCPDPIEFFEEKVGASIPLLATPQTLKLRVHVKLCLDEQRRVEGIILSDLEMK